MDSLYLHFGFALCALILFHGQVDSINPDCVTIDKCMTPGFEQLIRDKNAKDVCNQLHTALQCLEPRIASCLNSLTAENTIASVLHDQLNRMKSTYRRKCNEDAFKGFHADCFLTYKCMTSDFEKVVTGKATEKLCNEFPAALDCLRPKTENCKASFKDSDPLVDVLIQKMDRLESAYNSKCLDDNGVSDTSGCTQHEIESCMDDFKSVGRVDLKAMCETGKLTKKCLQKFTKDECPPGHLKQMALSMLMNFEPSLNICGEGGDGSCSFFELQACFENPKSDDIETICKAYPKAMKCFEPIKDRCDHGALRNTIKQAENKALTMKSKCEEQGYDVGGDGNGGIQNYSDLFIMAAAVLLAASFYF